MDNATVQTTVQGASFLAGYWEFAQWALIATGVIFLILAIPMRRPGKAFGVVLLGLYATSAWYFMTVYDAYGYDFEMAVAAVIVIGLVVLAAFYYFVFIRTT